MKKLLKRILIFIVTIGVIAGGITFALTSPIFNIKDIQVLNNSQVSSDTIISLSELRTDQNIFKFSSNNVIEKIKENPYVENVEVHRKIPSTVQIEIEERIPTYSVDYIKK